MIKKPSLLLPVSLVLALVTVRVSAVDFSIRASSGGGDELLVGTEQIFSVDLGISNDAAGDDAAIQGFQMAVSHDGQFLELGEVVWEGTDLQDDGLNGGRGPDFYLVQPEPAGGTGFTLGVIFEEDSPNFVLGAGDHVVARASYLSTASTGDQPTAIAFATSLAEPPIENKYTTRAGETLDVAATSGASVSIANSTYSIHFAVSSFSVEIGEEIVIPIDLQNVPVAVDGFSFGIKHDASRLTFNELRVGAGLTAVLGDSIDNQADEDSPYFFARNTSPGGGDGFTIAVILGTRDAGKSLDPASSPHRIFEAVYTASGQGVANVEITGDLGQPPVGVFLDLQGTSQTPLPPSPAPPTVVGVAIGGEVLGEPFLRGDTDQGGSLNISDAVSILQYLFSPAAIRNQRVKDTIDTCLVVFNVDGSLTGGEESDRGINVTDVVVLLNFQFQGGGRPAAPFPGCGQSANPVSPSFLCSAFDCGG